MRTSCAPNSPASSPPAPARTSTSAFLRSSGIPGQQRQPRLLRLLRQLALELAQLLRGHLAQLRVGEHLPRAGDVAAQPAVGDGQIVELAQLAVLAHQARKERAVGDDLRLRDADGQFFIARFDRLELARDAFGFVEILLQDHTLLAQTTRGMPLRSLRMPDWAHSTPSCTSSSTRSASPIPTSR